MQMDIRTIEPGRESLLPAVRQPALPARPLAGPRLTAPRPEDPGGKLSAYWRIARRRKWIILLSGLVCALLGYGLAVITPPKYRARAVIEIQNVNSEFLNRNALDPNATRDASREESFLLTQVQLVKSESQLRRVIAKIGVPPQSPSYVGGKTKTLSLQEHLVKLGDALTAKPIGFTRLVEVTLEGADAGYSTRFINELCDDYVRFNVESQRAATGTAGTELAQQLDGLRRKLTDAEERLSAYAQGEELFITDAENADELRLKQLQTELSAAQTQRMSVQSNYERSTAAPVESLPVVLDDAALKEIRTKITELQRELADLAVSLKPTHYKIKALQAQLGELDRTYNLRKEQLVSRLLNDYEAARRREDLVANSTQQQRQLVSGKISKTLRYATLKREVEVNRGIYESMLRRAKEAEIFAALHPGGVRVVDRADVPEKPFSPVRERNAALGGLAGVLIAAVAFIARRSSGNHLWEPGEASALLSLPELGAIPKRAALEGTLGWSKALVRRGHTEPALVASLGSVVSDSFRQAATTLLLHQSTMGPYSFVIASPSVGEGKTSSVSNIGMLLASSGNRTLLIDGDLRQPQLHLVFSRPNGPAQPASPGLDAADVAAWIHQTDHAKLDLLPAAGLVNALMLGSVPLTDSNALLMNADFGSLLATLKKQYDVILIDTPPLLHVADARLLAKHSDGVVLVLSAAKTQRELALEAARMLEEDGSWIIGTLFNEWDPTQSVRGDAFQRYRSSYGKVGRT